MTIRTAVIIPAHNAAAFLAQAIDCVLAQTVATELVVIDDGSSDRTAEIASAYGDHLTLVRQERRGLGGARNRGVAESKAPWIAFLDADDLWPEDKIARQEAILAERPEIDMVFGHGIEFSDPAGRWPVRDTPFPALIGSALMLRRDLFERAGSFFEAQRVGEFIDWYSRAQAAGGQSHVLPDIVLQRRVHGSNMTRLAGQRGSEYLDVMRAHLQRRRGTQ